jgi:hypothetical protein
MARMEDVCTATSRIVLVVRGPVSSAWMARRRDSRDAIKLERIRVMEEKRQAKFERRGQRYPSESGEGGKSGVEGLDCAVGEDQSCERGRERGYPCRTRA